MLQWCCSGEVLSWAQVRDRTQTSALQLLQHSLDNNCMQNTNGKVNLKLIERECGLESFVPFSLLETMKRKELHKLLNHFLKLNHQLCPSGQKCLTSTQAKLHYLRIISELPSYGAKIFSLNIRDATIESGLLVSPRFGISHVNSMRNSLPISLAKIEDISYIKVTKNDELFYCIEVQLKAMINDRVCQSLQSPLRFELEDRDAEEFVLMIRGYHKLFNKYDNNPTDKDLPVFWDISEEWWNDSGEWRSQPISCLLISIIHLCRPAINLWPPLLLTIFLPHS